MNVDDIHNRNRVSYNQNAFQRDSDFLSDWKLQEFEKVVKLKDNGKILDLGAGNGVFSTLFQNKGFDVLCADFSIELLKLCRKKKLKTIEIDFNNLEKISSVFDIIWAMNSLLHIPKKDFINILSKVKNLLHKDSIFYLGMYGGKNFEGIYEADFYSPNRFFSFYTFDDLKKILEENFMILSLEQVVIEDRDLDFLSFILKKK